MKIRVRFAKYGVLKFIGHLDVMRYFQKALRRAKIDIQYTQGFSPHQKMSFASPLGVGITSEGEYMDIEVGVSEGSEESLRRLNETMAEGITCLSYRKLPEDAMNAMASVAAARYKVTFREGMGPEEGWQEKLLDWYKKETIPIVKKTKKGERELDLKPLIYELFITDDGQAEMFLSAGSSDNIKPELVMETFCESIGVTLEKWAVLVHRCDMYCNMAKEGKPAKFVSLDDVGSDF